ncbi:MAG TPA: hypothetical protein V6C76_06925 [Drouetiella sp.]
MEFGSFASVAAVGQAHMYLPPPAEPCKKDSLPDGTAVYVASCGSMSYISFASGMLMSRSKNGTAFVNASNGEFWFGFEEIWMRIN